LPTRGQLKVGYNVNIGYFAQNQDDLMDGDFTVFDTLDRVAVGDIRTRLRDILGSFLFRGEQVDKKVKVLSGGERSRLAMARLMLEPYNLLILDEPTNHMDMRSKDILKLALNRFDGTVILISHDREFLDGLVQTVYEFRDGGVKQYLGGIYDFIEKRKLANLKDIEAKATVQTSPKKSQSESTTELTYAQKKEQDKQQNALRRSVERTEAEVEVLEGLLKELDQKLIDPAQYTMALFEEYSQTKTRLEEKMTQWEQANEKLELFNNGK
ncbi:MAG: ATP-binding cassette domain-containing protein, partial [Mucinivorans sp.]